VRRFPEQGWLDIDSAGDQQAVDQAQIAADGFHIPRDRQHDRNGSRILHGPHVGAVQILFRAEIFAGVGSAAENTDDFTGHKRIKTS
jgi:hypothetical protein